MSFAATLTSQSRFLGIIIAKAMIVAVVGCKFFETQTLAQDIFARQTFFRLLLFSRLFLCSSSEITGQVDGLSKHVLCNNTFSNWYF